jgi:hypothetical protein
MNLSFLPGLQRVILKHLAAIKTEQKRLCGKVEEILSLLENNSNGGDGQSIHSLDFSTLPILPRKTEEELQILEDWLSCDTEKQKFVSSFIPFTLIEI